MAEIVFLDGKARAVQIPGMEAFNDTVMIAEEDGLAKLALIKFDDDGAVLNDQAYAAGVALEKGEAGEYIGYGTHCEIAGFDNSVTAAGDLVYPSEDVPGGLATAADALVVGAGIAPPCGRVTPDNKRIKLFFF